MKKKRHYTPADPKRRAKAAIVGLYVHLAAAAAMGVLTAAHLVFMLQEGVGAPAPTDFIAPGFQPYLIAFGLVAIVYLITLAVYLVLFLMWVHRTNRNAHTLAKGLDISPAWAVGWFFVPFASLIKPFQGLDQTWRISTDPTRWKALDTPALLRWWWAFFLASNILGSLSNLGGKSATTTGLAVSTGMGVITFVLIVAHCLVAARLVRQLTDRQVLALSTAAFA